MPRKYSTPRAKMQAQKRAAQRCIEAKWKLGQGARATIQAMQEAEAFALVDRQHRSFEEALRAPNVCFYQVQPGEFMEAIADPRIGVAYDAGVPIFLCFMRAADFDEMKSAGRTLQLVAMPVAGRA